MSTTAQPSSTTTHTTLGKPIEICIATTSLTTSIRELASFGIQPWKVYYFDTRTNVRDGTIDSRSAEFRLRVGFSQLTSDIAYEVIEPIDAHVDGQPVDDVFSSWLGTRNHHAGIHHIAYDMDGVQWDVRMKRFEDLGAQFVQGGTWLGKRGTCRFAWFRKHTGDGGEDGSLGATSTFFETILFSEDWEDPEPDEIH